MGKCKDCKFWQKHEDSELFGFCKRHAPNPTVLANIEGMNFQIIWPSTGKDDTCGEHESGESIRYNS